VERHSTAGSRVRQQANILDPRQSHVGLRPSLMLSLQTTEHQSPEHHVPHHQTAATEHHLQDTAARSYSGTTVESARGAL